MNIPLKRLLPLAILLLLLLLIICFIGDLRLIQGKLANNSHAALVAQGCDFAREDIRFSGRNGVLSGAISEQDRDFALSTVRGVRGVSKVRDNFTLDDKVRCSSRVSAPVATPVAAIAPSLAPALVKAPVPAAPVAVMPTCRALSANERQALQGELNAITNELPDVRFAIGNLSLTPALSSHLESAVSVLSKDEYKNSAVTIVGHTESGLLPIYNECLSSGRARAVQDFMISRGIDPNCISIAAAGGTNAVAGSDTAEGRKLNRRIEFLVQEVK